MLQPPPVQNSVTDGPRDLVTIPWMMYFESIRQMFSRVIPLRGLLAKRPSSLGKDDEDFLYYATDFARLFRWTGTAWERAPGEDQTAEIRFFGPVAPGTGWHLCDGTAGITRTNMDATTSSVTIPDLRGFFIKGGAVYTGTGVAAVAPGISGSVANESAHTHGVTGTSGAGSAHNHSIDHDHPAVTSGGPSATVLVVSAAGVTPVGTSTHTHSVDVSAFAGTSGDESAHTHDQGTLAAGAGTAHAHGVGTLAVDATGEPAKFVLLPYYRL